ncbi:hypothetical protein [Paraburkholderia sp. BL25I1N1]|nr:hypothetical protein [Paraburkholderia sp. BL25I1N1]
MIDIRQGARDCFLAARIGRQRQNQITAGLDEFEPPCEHLMRIGETPEAI